MTLMYISVIQQIEAAYRDRFAVLENVMYTSVLMILRDDIKDALLNQTVNKLHHSPVQY